MTNNSRISKIVVSNIMPNNIKVVPISIMNKKLGKLHTETTCDSVCTSYITTKIKNKFGKELAKEIIEMKKYDGIVGELVINESGIIESPSVLKQIVNAQPVVVE